jgi:hypothetical protein
MSEGNSLFAYNCKAQLYATCIYYTIDCNSCQEGIAGLFRLSVLVVGYGPVGKGIAERARDLGVPLLSVKRLEPGNEK